MRTVYYNSGRSDRIEVAVRRALMTSVSQVTQKISEQNAEEFGADGWEISAHCGARPSHAVYQGRQYPNSQYETIVKPLIEDYNCRHSAYPVIMGLTKPSYTEGELAALDPPPFTYEGRTYTAYQAQQQMRKMERAMRKQKDLCIVADAMDDTDTYTAASIRLRRQKDIYEDFCTAAGTYTEYERTFVAGYNRRLAAKTGAVTRKQRAFDKAQVRLTNGGNGGIISARKLAAEKIFNFADFDILEDIQSVEDLKRFAADKMGITHMLGIEKLKNGKQAQTILSTVEELSRTYNVSFSRISFVDFGNEKTAAEVLGGELRLNVEYMNRPNALKAVLDEWEATGYIPKGCNNLRYIGTHEFGHLLTADLIDEPHSKIKTEINRALNSNMILPSANAKMNGYHEIVADIFAAVKLDSKQQALKNKIMKLILRG